MSTVATATRNPGPSWGFGFLAWAEQSWPRWFFRPVLMAGTWVGLAFMPAQRAHSRAYLAVVFGRPARLVEVWRHFFAFADFLMLKLRAGRGVGVKCTVEPANNAMFEAQVRSKQPALFGTFHFGGSDLLGYLLSDLGQHVSILRMRVGNSGDTRRLGEQFAGHVSFLWVNDPSQMLFALKTAIEAGESLALQCDRVEHVAKTEAFHFLGARRLFPFTIYHVGILFQRPVIFCIAVPDAQAPGLRVTTSPVFTPDPNAGRAANTQAARAHFQAVLVQLEILLRQNPYLWFNFLPLNPVVPAPAG